MSSMPELKSVTMAGIVAGIEEQTGCAISDAKITAEIFATVGTLADFIDSKID